MNTTNTTTIAENHDKIARRAVLIVVKDYWGSAPEGVTRWLNGEEELRNKALSSTQRRISDWYGFDWSVSYAMEAVVHAAKGEYAKSLEACRCAVWWHAYTLQKYMPPPHRRTAAQDVACRRAADSQISLFQMEVGFANCRVIDGKI